MEHTESKALDETTRSSYWRAHFERWKASSQNQPDYCLEHGLNVHTFKYWRQKLGQGKPKKEKPLKLVPITKAPAREVKKDLMIRIAADGVSLEVSVDVDPTILKGIIKALRG